MRALALLVVLVGMVSAQGDPSQREVLTLAVVLDQAPALDPDVQGAENGLRSAERTLERYQADPLALKVPTLLAQGAVENARAALESARLTSTTEATSAYFGALAANSSLRIAERALALEAAKLQATQIRFEAGAATAVELLQADNSLAEAQRNKQDAEQARDLAYRTLGGLIGRSVSRVAPISLTVPAVPTLEQSLERASATNSGVQAAATSVAVVEAELAAVDNAFSAQADIDAARDSLTGAKSDLQTARRSLELSVRQAHGELERAARGFENARASFAASWEELAAQEARLAAGSLAPIAFEESQLAHLQSEADLYSALYSFRLTALQLEGTISGGSTGGDFSIDTSAPASETDGPASAEPSSGVEDAGEDGSGITPDAAPTEPDATEPETVPEEEP